MREKIRLPKLDQDMTEGGVVEWLVAEGDDVVAGQPVVVVETDKVTTEVEAPIAGILEAIVVPAGETAPVAAELASIATADEPAPQLAATPPAPPPTGRIPLDRSGWKRPSPPVRDGAPATQRALVRTVERSWAIPQFSVRADVPAQPLLDLVAEHTGAAVRISLTHVLVKLAGVACHEVPAVNAHYVDGMRVGLDDVDVNVLVHVEGGLLNPCVRGVRDKSLAQIAADTGELVAACRDSTIAHADLAPGSLTISNLGMYGVDEVTPLLFPPQVAILGVGQVAGRPATLRATLVADHRALHGVDSARWLAAFRHLCDDPSEVLAHA